MVPMSCSNVDGFIIAMEIYNTRVMEIRTNLPDNVNSSYDIEISVENWKPTKIMEIQISLYHNPEFTLSNLSQRSKYISKSIINQ